MASYALKTYRRNNSIKRWELIEKLYGAFIGKDWYEFYERIKDGEQIDSSKDGKLLNKTLTLFDALNYFQTQGLLDKKAWEYVACEILNFALNNSGWEYMNNIKKPYVEEGFPEDIIPFTDFPELFDKLPKKFKKSAFHNWKNDLMSCHQKSDLLIITRQKIFPMSDCN